MNRFLKLYRVYCEISISVRLIRQTMVSMLWKQTKTSLYRCTYIYFKLYLILLKLYSRLICMAAGIVIHFVFNFWNYRTTDFICLQVSFKVEIQQMDTACTVNISVLYTFAEVWDKWISRTLKLRKKATKVRKPGQSKHVHPNTRSKDTHPQKCKNQPDKNKKCIDRHSIRTETKCDIDYTTNKL